MVSCKVIPVHMSGIGDKIQLVLVPGYISDVVTAMHILYNKRSTKFN